MIALLIGGFISYFWWLKSDHNYSKGVLALNTDQSFYLSGETVLFQMASLDKNGDTLCNSNLQLEIAVPKQWKKDKLLYQDKQIVTTATCSPDNNVTNEPDYIARYVTSQPGKYKLKLTNLDTGKQVTSEFQVFNPDAAINNDHPSNLQISRSGATRINPFKSDRYPMIIKVTAKNGFKGKLVEQVPLDFQLQWIGTAQVTENKMHKILSWEVDLKPGESKDFAYEYDAADVSPNFVRFRKIKLLDDVKKQIVIESHHWQVVLNAIDLGNH